MRGLPSKRERANSGIGLGRGSAFYRFVFKKKVWDSMTESESEPPAVEITDSAQLCCKYLSIGSDHSTKKLTTCRFTTLFLYKFVFRNPKSGIC